MKLEVANDEVRVEQPAEFQGEHSEADMLLAFHARQEEGNIIVRSSDTDVLLILICMIHQDQEEEKAVKYGRVLMDYGVGNNRRFINVTSIYKLSWRRRSQAFQELYSACML